MLKILFVLPLLILMTGCAHTISEEFLSQAEQELSFSQLRQDPEKYENTLVVLGGVIVETNNKQDGTLLEIYQTRINRQGKPVDLDISEGRFLAFCEQTLDPAIYRQGRKITLAGRVQGKKIGELGAAKYTYPLLETAEIHLWAENHQETAMRYQPYPWHFPYPYSHYYGPY